jgi:hypothetical protein
VHYAFSTDPERLIPSAQGQVWLSLNAFPTQIAVLLLCQFLRFVKGDVKHLINLLLGKMGDYAFSQPAKSSEKCSISTVIPL